MPHALPLGSSRLSIAQFLLGKTLPAARSKPLQNSFDFYRKEELLDEEGSGEKSWLQPPCLLNPVNSTFMMSTPASVVLGL